MTTALYRIASNEVLKVSTNDQLFTDRDVTFFGVLTAPSVPDGTAVREDLGDGTLGPLRQFGFAKIAIPGSNTVQNATQPEIDAFGAPQIDDDNQQDADRAADLGDVHPQFRKVIKAILKGVIRENNIMAARYNELRAEILAASSLNNLQTRVTNNTSDAPTRTNQQAFNAVRTDVSKDD